MHKNVPFRLVSITVSKSASFIIITRPSRVTPALFTRISTLPRSFFTWATVASTACSSRTSQG